MFAEKRIIAIIPARGGSKGIPKKNITLLNGNPLLYYTAQAAEGSKYLDDVYLSTEDPTISKIGLELGMSIIKRPRKLATDATKGIDVVKHAISYLSKKNVDIDVIVILQPTSPLRTSSDIDGCIEMLVKNNLDSVISMVNVRQHPNWMFRMDKMRRVTPIYPELNTRRQQHEKLFYPNGAVFVSTINFVLKQNSIMYGGACGGYVMDEDRSIDIDTPYDLEVCQYLLTQRISQGG